MQTILTEVDYEGSVLFLGSGFSQGARNIKGTNLPTGRELKNRFAELLGAAPDDYDLPTLADAVNADPNLSLHDLLYETFTVSQLADHQKDVLARPWLRIYTTNYDDSIELFHQNTRRSAQSYSYNDPKPPRLPSGTVIHLHGMIRNISDGNVLDQLILSEEAYVRQHFEVSPWYDEFVRDIKVCSACYFVGYSLKDYHVSAILMQNPGVLEKIFFITEPSPDPLSVRTMARYGQVVSIGVDSFNDVCKALPVAPPLTSDPHSLKLFRYLDPLKDKRTLAPPTAVEVLNLLRYGSFNYQRCISTLPKAHYVVPRQTLANEAAEKLETARCLLVHSRIGNGKTTFLYILAHTLFERGYRCFLCKSRPTQSYSHVRRDIQILKGLGNAVIFFDSYDTAIELADELKSLPSAKFVVSVRTGVQSVRSHEILSQLPSPIQSVNLNGIQQTDVDDFRKLLDSIGISADEQQRLVRHKNDFRDVMLALFDNTKVRKGILEALQPLLDDAEYKRIFIVCHLLKWVDQETDDALLRIVTRSDPYMQVRRYPDVSADIFSFEDDNFGVRSSILSEYLIKRHLTAEELIPWIYRLVIEAVKRKSERRNRVVLRRLMRFSPLYQAFRNDVGLIERLTDLFERWRRDDLINKEPLFWLQYAILKTEANDLELAESFIETAYGRAREIPGFRTYQIDTYALRLLLIAETRSADAGPVTRFDRIIDKLEQIRPMIGDTNYRWHAVQVLAEMEPFASIRAASMSNGERIALTYQLRLLLQQMRLLSDEARDETGAAKIEKKVERSIDAIVDADSADE